MSGDKRRVMNTPIAALRVAGTIFGIVSLAHVWRLVTRAEVLVAGYSIPFWVSVIAVLVAGGLSVWMWRVSAGKE